MPRFKRAIYYLFLAIGLLLSSNVNARNFVVELDVFADTSNSKPQFEIQTNLPDGMELMLTLTRPESRYVGQCSVVVKNKKAISETFSFKGRSLNPGTYELGITSSLAELQPPEIWPIIGRRGERMRGKNITEPFPGAGTFVVNSVWQVKIGSKVNKKKDEDSIKAWEEGEHLSWLSFCREICGIAKDKSLKNLTDKAKRCYYGCVADEPPLKKE